MLSLIYIFYFLFLWFWGEMWTGNGDSPFSTLSSEFLMLSDGNWRRNPTGIWCKENKSCVSSLFQSVCVSQRLCCLILLILNMPTCQRSKVFLAFHERMKRSRTEPLHPLWLLFVAQFSKTVRGVIIQTDLAVCSWKIISAILFMSRFRMMFALCWDQIWYKYSKQIISSEIMYHVLCVM